MALLKDMSLENGLHVNGAYIRIDVIGGNKAGITVSTSSYLSREAYLECKACLSKKCYWFIPDLTDGAYNFIKQAYEYLKTLPEFEGAADC